jgi:histone deacetylase 1/2
MLQLSAMSGAIVSGASSSTSVGIAPSIPIRLDHTNFMLWKGLLLRNLSGVGLHGYLDGSEVAPSETVTQGEGDKATTIPNANYYHWWTQDQKVLGLLLGSMDPAIACQLIGCKTAEEVWKSVHALFGAQSRDNVRHIRRQLQTLRKEEDMTTAVYMQKMKSLSDVMAAAGAPINNDELVDYIITGLGR